MNVFDFDGTIYDGDSETDFFFYCVRKYPKVRKHLFPCAFYGIGYFLKFVDKEYFKQKFLSFVKYVDDIDEAVENFWKINRKKIKKWYLAKKDETDIIISASPEFLLIPICKALGVECLMATRADKHTGVFTGLNCHGEEKVRRLHEKYPDAEIDEFYSDLYCDTPLANLSKKAYIVKRKKIKAWKKAKR